MMLNKKQISELMEIIIDRKILLNALTNAKPMTSGGHILAILSSILIETKDNAVEITATDLGIGFQGIYPANIINSGSIVIPNRELSNFVSKSKASEISIKEKEKNCVSLSDGSLSLDVFCMDADDFPMTPEEIKIETPIGIDAFILKSMIIKTVIPRPQNARDAKKSHIAGSLFKIFKKNGQSSLCATSYCGGILVEESKEVSISGKINNAITEDGILIPKDMLTKLNRSLLRNIKKPAKKTKRNKGLDSLSDSNIALGVQGNFIIIKKQNETAIIRLLEGKFPSYHIAITRDKENKFPVLADRQILLGAMKQLSSLADSNYQKMEMTIEMGTIKMCFINPAKGEMRKEVPVQYNGDKIEGGYSPMQFANFLNLMRSDIVKLDIINLTTPCLLTGEQDKDILFVLMPFCTN